MERQVEVHDYFREANDDVDTALLCQVIQKLDRVERNMKSQIDAQRFSFEEGMQQVSNRLEISFTELREWTSSASSASEKSTRSSDITARRSRNRK